MSETELREHIQQLKADHQAELSQEREGFRSAIEAMGESIKTLEARKDSNPNTNWSSLLLGHTFTSAGTVMVHGRYLTVWECIDGCNSNPLARIRLLLPAGITP